MTRPPSAAPPAPLSAEEETAWRALARAVLVIPRVLDGELLEAERLNLAKYSVLMNLSEQPGRSMRMTALANAASLTSSGLTRVVDRLARQVLVERVQADTDRRGQLAALTPAGFARLERAYPTHLAGVRGNTSWTTSPASTSSRSPTLSPVSPQPR